MFNENLGCLEWSNPSPGQQASWVPWVWMNGFSQSPVAAESGWSSLHSELQGNELTKLEDQAMSLSAEGVRLLYNNHVDRTLTRNGGTPTDGEESALKT